CQQHSSYSFNF
nr:immunoglobulin light chain junction region [Macaca mulatta]